MSRLSPSLSRSHLLIVKSNEHDKIELEIPTIDFTVSLWEVSNEGKISILGIDRRPIDWLVPA